MNPIIPLFGLGVGILVGMTGIGGGSLMTPLLILVLGTKPVVAVGTDLSYAAITKTVGAWRHWRQGTVDLGTSLWLAVGSVPGAIAGVWILRVLRDAYGAHFDTLVIALVAGALALTGAMTLARALFMARAIARERERVTFTAWEKVAAVAIGLTVGFVLGVTSAGSGALIAIGLIMVFRLTPRRVVGTDVFHAAILLWVAAVAHLVNGDVDLGLAGGLLLGSIPGVWIGSSLAIKVPPATLRPVLGIVLVSSGVALASKAGADVPPIAILATPAVLALFSYLVVRRPWQPARAPVRRSPGGTMSYELSHLRTLESEAVYIMREVAAELERPVLLFSGGKDSLVLLRLAEKAFRPGRFPFPVMHVDTGHNFPEVIAFRDRVIEQLGERLIVASVQASIDNGRVVEPHGPRASRNQLQTTTLLDAIEEHGFTAAIGGARRDEERARAKERVFSFRDDFSQWDPKNQRPELWSIYNARVARGEHVRVFPLSNWTELDVWQYIAEEGLEVPSIYLAHEREVFRRDGMLYAVSPHVELMDGEEPFLAWVRYRTVGDMTCTGAVASTATTLDEVIAEIAASRITERGETRADDRVSEAAMEDRKRVGYF